MIKKILLFLLLFLLLILVILPFFLPKNMMIQVEKTFDHPVPIVYDEFDNLKNYSEWDQWSQLDSKMTKEFYPPYKGVGASYKWKSKQENIGEGQIKIIESVANQKITYENQTVNWDGAAMNTAEFTAINEGATKVVWTLNSMNFPYFYRYLGFFIPKQIESSMTKGLSNLEEKLNLREVNSKSNEVLQPGYVGITNFVGQKMVSIENETSTDKDEIAIAINESLSTLKSFLFDAKKMDPESVGYPTVYWKYRSETDEKYQFLCGFPITQSLQLNEDDDFLLSVLPSSRAIVSIYSGNRDSLFTVYNQMQTFAKQNDLKLSKKYWEVYIDKESVLGNETLTKVYIGLEE